MQDLIPGLLDDIAWECLIRLDYHCLFISASVCRRWRDETQSAQFFRRRRLAGTTSRLLVFTYHLPDTNAKDVVLRPGQRFSYKDHLVLYDPAAEAWRRLPSPPIIHSSPPFCPCIVGVGHKIVTISEEGQVQVFDFYSGNWRWATSMPAPSRQVFARASDGIRHVFVAGGLNLPERSRALKSALSYDVDEDRWEPLPDLVRSRYDCAGCFHEGAFHVIGGSSITESYGIELVRGTEELIPSSGSWKDGKLVALNDNGVCTVAPDGKFYSCFRRKIFANDGGEWRPVVDLPANIAGVTFISAGKESLLVCGFPFASWIPPILTLLSLALGPDNPNLMWTEIKVPDPVRACFGYGACIEI